MKAFHNNPSIKEKYITRVQEHYQADQIIKGQYWEDGKGCAVGCTIHSNYHKNYELELGIPKIIAHLQDRIFESLPNELAKEFPLQFLSAIKVGADLKNVWNLFMIWVLTDKEYGVMQYAKDKKVVQDIADTLVQDIVSPVSAEKWAELKKDAIAAADSCASHAAYAAAAYSAVYSVAAAYSVAASFVENTKSEWNIAASNKLIELLKNSN